MEMDNIVNFFYTALVLDQPIDECLIEENENAFNEAFAQYSAAGIADRIAQQYHEFI
jgi:hypothetical protein